MRNKRGFLQISFGWIFALIVGAFVLFLAIYLAINILDIGGTTQDVIGAKQIGVLLNPLETGLGEDTKTILDLGEESRIYANCEEFGEFGEQNIRTSQKDFGEWTNTQIDVSFENKYIFAEVPVEGERFYVFSKPFEMPFKVTDLNYIMPRDKKYCFVDSPSDIVDEIEGLGLDNIETVSRLSECSEPSERVCFDGGNCDIEVNTRLEFIEKDGERVNYKGDALMYAGIFSEPREYECQIARLGKRIAKLGEVYEDKKIIIAEENCNSGVSFEGLISRGENLEDSGDLEALSSVSESVERLNRGVCRLW